MTAPSPATEVELLAWLARRAEGRGEREGIVTGIGDDCAVLVAGGEQRLLLTVDTCLDGRHFELADCGAERAAAKSVNVSLSDIAAMGGGERGWVLLAVTFDTRRPVAERRQLLEAASQATERGGFELIGGDITAHAGPTTISSTAGAYTARPILRSGARPGDALFVSGTLGGSRRSKHLDFEPRLELAAALQEFHPRAMLDVTDGLAIDLDRICRASGVGATLEAERLPLSPDASHGIDSALGDGEDFELLFALSPEEAQRMPTELAGVRLTRIGAFEAAPGTRLRSSEGDVRVLPAHLGFDHLEGSAP